MTTHTLPPSRPLQLPALAGWVVFTFVFAAIGAFATSQAGAFYQQLDRPAWAPPAWLFGPAWSGTQDFNMNAVRKALSLIHI